MAVYFGENTFTLKCDVCREKYIELDSYEEVVEAKKIFGFTVGVKRGLPIDVCLICLPKQGDDK